MKIVTLNIRTGTFKFSMGFVYVIGKDILLFCQNQWWRNDNIHSNISQPQLINNVYAFQFLFYQAIS